MGWLDLLRTDLRLFDTELVRLTFVFGIAVSVGAYERNHITTGSLVVPGYIGVSLLSPASLVATAINATITYLCVARLIPKFAVIFGRAQFVANIYISLTISMLLGPGVAAIAPASTNGLNSIGYVIPALIAYDMNRQGVKKTVSAVTATGVIAATPALLLVALQPEIVDRALRLSIGLIELDNTWMPLAALISTGVATTLHTNYQLRCGGFIGAMYIGLAVQRPLQVVYFFAVAVLTWFLVAVVLRRWMVLFGRRKFAVMLMGGSVLSWALLEWSDMAFPDALAISDLPIAALFVPALLANDMERASVLEVGVGGALAAMVAMPSVVIAAAIIDVQPVPMWAPPALLFGATVLFWPQISRSFRRPNATIPTFAPGAAR